MTSCLTNHTRRRLVVALGQTVAAQEVEDLLCGGGSVTDSFTTIQADSGTSPVADSATDTLTISGSTYINTVGDSVTDTIQIDLDTTALEAAYPNITVNLSGTYVKIDQTTPQIVTGGVLRFASGISVDSGGGSVINVDTSRLQLSYIDGIRIKVGSSGQVEFIDGAILPITANDIDLGSAAKTFKDAYIDGTVFTENIEDDTVLTLSINGIIYQDLFSDAVNFYRHLGIAAHPTEQYISFGSISTDYVSALYFNGSESSGSIYFTPTTHVLSLNSEIVEVGVGTPGVDYILRFNGQSNDGALTWMEDENYFTFDKDVTVPDEAYDATTWNGSLEVPTKNAIRDKIEAMFSLPSLTSGSVLFSDGSTIAQDNSNFFWDDTNNRLGIGTKYPATSLDINGSAVIASNSTLGSDQVANGNFTSAFTSWSVAGSPTWTHVPSGVVYARCQLSASAATLSQTISVTVNTVYEVSFDIVETQGSSWSLFFSFAGFTSPTITQANGLGNIKFRFITTTTGGINDFKFTGTCDGSSFFGIDNVVLKEIIGGSAYVGANVYLNGTTASTLGVIYKDNNAFLHDFSHPTGSSAVPQGYNVMLGRGAGNFTMGSTATSTVHGSENCYILGDTGASTTTGYRNIGIGRYALSQNTTGYQNIAVGFQAMYGSASVTGNTNAAVGYYALNSITSGTLNVAFGSSALRSVTTTSQNIGIGSDAGYLVTAGTGNTTPTDSIFIGRDTRAAAIGQTNQIVIGAGARGNGSNTVTLGHTDITATYLRGNITIGQSTAGVDYSITFDGENNNGIITFMEDENLFKLSTDISDASNIASVSANDRKLYDPAGDEVASWVGGDYSFQANKPADSSRVGGFAFPTTDVQVFELGVVGGAFSGVRLSTDFAGGTTMAYLYTTDLDLTIGTTAHETIIKGSSILVDTNDGSAPLQIDAGVGGQFLHILADGQQTIIHEYGADGWVAYGNGGDGMALHMIDGPGAGTMLLSLRAHSSSASEGEGGGLVSNGTIFFTPTGQSYAAVGDNVFWMDYSSGPRFWFGGNTTANFNYDTNGLLNWTENISISKRFSTVAGALTIASGVVTCSTSYHVIDTEGAAASDDLDTISASGAATGTRLVIRAANSARTVVVKDGTGNLKLAGDFSLDNAEDTMELIYDGSNWLELSRSDNGA